MNLKCVIVDDEYLAIRILEDYCSRMPGVDVVRSFKDPLKAMTFLRENAVDLLFLDIRMPQVSGIDLAAGFSARPPARNSTATRNPQRTRIVFTTASPEFAVRAFDLEALDYLVKPISFQRFQVAVRKAQEVQDHPSAVPAPAGGAPETPGFLLLKSDHRTLKIGFEDLILIEGLNEYIRVHTKDKKIISLAALKDLEIKLPPTRFARIHKSYIVSLRHVRSWSATELELSTGLRLPLGRVFKENFLQRMKLFF